jgi:hypothetical protein
MVTSQQKKVIYGGSAIAGLAALSYLLLRSSAQSQMDTSLYTVTVLDNSSKNPLPGATVKLSNGSQQGTDSNGNAVFPVVPYGSYSIMVSLSGYQTQTQSVVVNQVVQMTTISLVVVQVTTANGVVIVSDATTTLPIPNATVAVGSFGTTQTDSTGTASFTSVPFATYSVAVSAGANYTPRTIPLTVNGPFSLQAPLQPIVINNSCVISDSGDHHSLYTLVLNTTGLQRYNMARQRLILDSTGQLTYVIFIVPTSGHAGIPSGAAQLCHQTSPNPTKNVLWDISAGATGQFSTVVLREMSIGGGDVTIASDGSLSVDQNLNLRKFNNTGPTSCNSGVVSQRTLPTLVVSSDGSIGYLIQSVYLWKAFNTALAQYHQYSGFAIDTTQTYATPLAGATTVCDVAGATDNIYWNVEPVSTGTFSATSGADFATVGAKIGLAGTGAFLLEQIFDPSKNGFT